MKHYYLMSLLLLAGRLGAAQGLVADTTATVKVYGYIDGYFGLDFPAAAGTVRPAFIYSHNRQNEFTVNQALVGLRYDDGVVHGALGLQAGTYPEANYAAEPAVFQHIYEAYAGFRPFKKAWLDLGIFGSHIGYESAISKDNWTLTHSLAAEGSPYYEAGAKLRYEVSPQVTVTGLVLNGWQNIRDNNRGKAVGTQVQWRPSARWLFNSSTFLGNEQPTDSVRRQRFFHDFYLTYAASSRLSVLALFDVGTQQARRAARGADTWHTGALLVRYRFSPLPRNRWTAALRAEYYYAKNGVVVRDAGPRASAPDYFVRGGSLNVDYAPARRLLVRLEGKVLNARNPLFDSPNQAPARTYGNLTGTVALSL
ncbi:porin [Hymenobacter sp. H14-R3]|uniref:porin n=1 Tax=Hymenobacter sp. H14-R3 TaxID=3046308 RepID=UPI0024BAF866|nr:porin [Hymenobacter sp. H14-R3]MDJ0366492.1 porin [Hymenobacter sp. H14-R3]